MKVCWPIRLAVAAACLLAPAARGQSPDLAPLITASGRPVSTETNRDDDAAPHGGASDVPPAVVVRREVPSELPSGGVRLQITDAVPPQAASARDMTAWGAVQPPPYVDAGTLADPFADEVPEEALPLPAPPPHLPLASPAAGPLPPLGMLSPQQPDVVESVYERVLDLYPDRNSRQLIERVRQVVQETEVGIDVTEEDWVETDGTTLDWGGRLDLNWVSWAHDADFLGEPNYFEFRRLRLAARGEGYGVYEYQVEVEFVPEQEVELEVIDGELTFDQVGVELKDVYLQMRDVPLLDTVAVGHLRVPIGLANMTGTRNQPFMERPLPSQLLPVREVGVAAYSFSENESTTWAYGVFLDDVPEVGHRIEDDNQGIRVAGRLTHTPMYDVYTDGRYLWHTGIGYMYTRPREQSVLAIAAPFRPVEFDARPEINRGSNLIDTDELNTDRYHTLNTEVAWMHGPLTLQSELTWTNLQLVDGSSLDLYGAYAQLGFFLTGEHREYNRRRGVWDDLAPYENFWTVHTGRGPKAGLGAWEATVRWSYLDFADVGNQHLHALSVGLNWYWSPRTRWLVGWIHPFARNSPESLLANAEGDIITVGMQTGF